MLMRTHLVLLLLMISLGATPATRGQAIDLAPGMEVRVTVHGAHATGHVEQVTTDSLLISKAAGQQVAFSWGDLRRVEAKRVKSYVVPFMLGGGGAGLFVGGLVGWIASDPEGNLTDPGFTEEVKGDINRGALIGAGIGVLVGGLIGALVRRERWEVVPHGAAFGTSQHGVGATVTVRF
jgi:hypothetical protein